MRTGQNVLTLCGVEWSSQRYKYRNTHPHTGCWTGARAEAVRSTKTRCARLRMRVHKPSGLPKRGWLLVEFRLLTLSRWNRRGGNVGFYTSPGATDPLEHSGSVKQSGNTHLWFLISHGHSFGASLCCHTKNTGARTYSSPIKISNRTCAAPCRCAPTAPGPEWLLVVTWLKARPVRGRESLDAR